MSATTKDPLGRRRFLRAVGSASSAAVAASAVSLVTADEAEAYDPGKEELRARYQPNSPHVQAFYRTNGFETLKK